ncbi:MAG TPA: redox-sensing transcriptional repressor Rex [Chloroflexota bacterium]|nr:redox-sensing transcriptional repressor Rex [Chloroflexota bacterium]
MENRPKVPTPSLNRLPLYYRYLLEAREQRLTVVSSEMLGDAAGVPAAQVRKDLGYLGEFGRPGIGYDVIEMQRRLGELLGLVKEKEVIVVGAGRLGSAISSYQGFATYGLRIAALFDSSPARIGSKVGGLSVVSMDDLNEYVSEHGIQMAILAVPASAAPKVAEQLVAAGIKAILNFAPVKLEVPAGVMVSNEDLAARLATLSFRMTHGRE